LSGNEYNKEKKSEEKEDKEEKEKSGELCNKNIFSPSFLILKGLSLSSERKKEKESADIIKSLI
jgi:hypothetical protein